ncbi:AMP-binding protein [Dactylosporangium sucinum]|uniref:Long-chain-fatty-acid--CoA/3-oxocholest-4-en-26-oate--CoA ligase n=1 Tax=Dactylosporangium sucinum TaxID=1424081 RepID=A0A917UB85_9ACTN|nr:AMP-binding protein [Dactylosporangium sucinum]GGM75254.1 long-chain-fatty-acid--CoA/3-oxocholest-4-en-26-oate--CoA ligase [Dactylosporangium sucinum]
MSAAEFDWNLATVWETIAEELPDAPAQIQGERTFTWADFERRANGVARTLLDGRASRDDRVTQYLRNSPEYLEVSHAAFKIGIPAINSNYRYRDEELRYLWEDADVTAVVFHGSFTATVGALRDRVPRVRQWIHVDDGTQPCPEWAIPYEQAAAASAERVRAPWGRGGDDLFLLYTGGTTGMPKGVMWRAADMLRQVNDVSTVHYALEDGAEGIRRDLRGPGQAHISGSPYMHGTGYFGATMAMHGGGCVVSLTAPGFDAAELLDSIDRYRVASLAISGEVFAKRIVDALAAEPGRWDSSTIRNVLTSGGMLGEQSKRALLEHWPAAAILDGFSSSEGFGMGWSLATKDSIPETGRFAPGPNVWVLDEHEQPVEPGSGVIGKLVVRNRLPMGYYKDPDKTARTFREINGVRTSVPGDHGIIHPDGTIQLMGRDSLCITSGGEKIFTEEVEGVILDHEAVTDVLVVGVPDPQWGQSVAAVVSVEPGAAPTAAELIGHVKARLAGYKAPKHVVFVESVPRSPNGKADYPAARALAEAQRQPVA